MLTKRFQHVTWFSRVNR